MNTKTPQVSISPTFKVGADGIENTEHQNTTGDGNYNFTGKDGKTYNLQFKQKRFAECYLRNGGNGSQAIIEAGYRVNHKNKTGEDTGVPNRNLAKVMAYEELRKPHITSLINAKLEEYGFNDDSVKEQHLFLLNQHADLKMKAKAVDMFYKLKGKYPKKIESDVNINVFSLAELAEKSYKRKQIGLPPVTM